MNLAPIIRLGSDALLSEHPVCTALDATPLERRRAYGRLLDEAISDDELHAIRHYLQQQRAWGRDDFRAMAEAKTQRFAGVRPAHRPAKPSPVSK